MKHGTKVKVKLSNGHFHTGEYLGQDPVFANVHFIGVLESTVTPGKKPRKGQKYISRFHAKTKQLVTIHE